MGGFEVAAGGDGQIIDFIDNFMSVFAVLKHNNNTLLFLCHIDLEKQLLHFKIIDS